MPRSLAKSSAKALIGACGAFASSSLNLSYSSKPFGVLYFAKCLQPVLKLASVFQQRFVFGFDQRTEQINDFFGAVYIRGSRSGPVWL